MRYYFNGSGYTVSFNHYDTEDFSSRWPCSTVEGGGSFSFSAAGDLIDTSGAAISGDGSDWLAFSEDCQKYGEPRYRKDRRRRQMESAKALAESWRPIRKKYQFWASSVLQTETDDLETANKIKTNHPSWEFRTS